MKISNTKQVNVPSAVSVSIILLVVADELAGDAIEVGDVLVAKTLWGWRATCAQK